MSNGCQVVFTFGPNMGKKRNTDSEASIKKEDEEEDQDDSEAGPAENLL